MDERTWVVRSLWSAMQVLEREKSFGDVSGAGVPESAFSEKVLTLALRGHDVHAASLSHSTSLQQRANWRCSDRLA